MCLKLQGAEYSMASFYIFIVLVFSDMFIIFLCVLFTILKN